MNQVCNRDIVFEEKLAEIISGKIFTHFIHTPGNDVEAMREPFVAASPMVAK